MSTQPVAHTLPTLEDFAALLDAGKVVGVLSDLISKLGETEHPANSNRSPFIDSIADEFGSPRGSSWCALLQGWARKRNNLWLPTQDVGATNEWAYQAMKGGKWSDTPTVGAVVVYTDGTQGTGRYAGQKHTVHVGCYVAPGIAIEGNTSAGDFDHNGGTCLVKPIATTRVYGYVLP